MATWLYIVIVNWNLKEDTLACVDSLIIAGAQVDHIIVVDNASSDGSVEALRQRFSATLPIIESNENLGYASGNNLGIQFALDQQAEWVLLLNNDTVVAPDLIHKLETTTLNYPEYSIVAPIIYYFDHPETIWYLGDHLVPGTLITMNKYRGKQEPQGFPAVIPVDFVSGCGMMINRKVFEDVGYFDSSLFMYGEEVDFCWRAQLAGSRLACATRAKIWHRVSISANKDRKKSRYLRIRNQVRFYRKYSQGYQLPLMFIFSLSRSLGLMLQDIIQHQTQLVKPLARGWLDGWFARNYN